jgi:hypothetical protein
MSTTATIRLYDMLKPKLGETEARMFIQHFEESFEEGFAAKSQQLTTKQDIADLRWELRVEIAQSRAEIIKWMFIFWIGQIATVIAIMKPL